MTPKTKCARKDCGHSEIRHPTCCQSRAHRFIEPLFIEGKVLSIGDGFYFNFEGDRHFPNDPRGWIQCVFLGRDTTIFRGVDLSTNDVVVKPKGFGEFVVSRRSAPAKFRLEVERRAGHPPHQAKGAT